MPNGLKALLGLEMVVLVGTIALSVFASVSGRPAPQSLIEVELIILAFSIVVLTVLTEFTARRSSNDIHSLVETIRSENRSLVAENKAHWVDQKSQFEGFLKTLTRLIELQVDLIAAVKRLDDAQKATMAAHDADLRAREEALRQEIEKQRPQLDIRISKWEGKVWKHFVVLVFNHGPPGVDLDVTFAVDGLGSSEHFAMVSQGSPCEKDFGDINDYSSSGQISVLCEVSSGTRTHRYRFQALYDYERNRGIWGSRPIVSRKSPEVLPAEVLY